MSHRIEHWPRVWGLVGPYKARVASLAALSFAAGTVEALFLVVVTRTALAIADGQDGGGLVAGWVLTWAGALGVAGALLATRFAAALLSIRVSTGLTTAVHVTLRRRLSESFLRASWATQQSEPPGRLQALSGYATSAATVVAAFTTSTSAMLNLAALLVVAVIVDPAATLLVVAVLIGLGGVLAPLRRRVRLRARAAQAAGMAYSRSIAELGSLGLEMQTYGVRDRFLESLDSLSEQTARANRHSARLSGALAPTYITFAYGALVGGLAVTALVGMNSISSLGAVLLVMLRSLSYGQALQTSSASLMSSLPFLEELEAALDRYRVTVAADGQDRPHAGGRIDAIAVNFAYRTGIPVLSDVTFTIEPGEVIGVIGPSGAGKSTLVQLLLGLREPSAGVIRIDGTDLRDVDRQHWTSHTAFVAQDAQLITGTVAENIRFFRDGIDEVAMKEACAMANVLADVERLPEGFDTHLGQRGSQLSGGQRQRVSIARALAGQPQFLVLDEPTSALDVKSESLIRATIDGLRGQTTVVVIAHRMTTLKGCDRIIVIDHGRVEGFGTAEELAMNNAFYRSSQLLSSPRDLSLDPQAAPHAPGIFHQRADK
jgi:ATP-binding cassette, subfamily B, bacterial